MPRQPRLAQWVAVTLLVLGGGAVVVGTLIERQASALSRDGVEASARIEQLVMHGSGTGKRYKAIVAPAPGVRLSLTVSDVDFRRLRVGDAVVVTHPPGHPEDAALGNLVAQQDAMTHARAARTGGGVGLVAGALLVVMAWRRRAPQMSPMG